MGLSENRRAGGQGGNACDKAGRGGGLILRAAGDTHGFQGTLACSDLGFEMLPLSAEWGTGAKMGAISRHGGPGQRWRQAGTR